jgi:hypothetical protein
MQDYLVRGEDGRELSMDDIPSVRILRGEEAEPLLIRTVHRENGSQRWNLLKAAPLRDDAGATEATITIIEDVTEQKRSELQNAFLVRVSAALASSLDYERRGWAGSCARARRCTIRRYPIRCWPPRRATRGTSNCCALWGCARSWSFR